MPVIINDFEIVVEPPPTPQPARGGGGEEGGSQPTPQPTLRPEDITLVMQVHRERVERVRAD
jgi:hypothetical protein